MKIAVVGLGYVGLSNAVLLAQNHDVTAVDVSAARVDLVNNRKSPIVDADLEDFLAHKSLQLTATTDLAAAARDAELVVIATPTDYDPHTNHFDTSSVENVARAVLAANPALAEMTRAAFGDEAGLTAARVALALEQYLLTLVSAGSRFDLALRGEAQLTADEQRGFELFATEYDPGRGRQGADCFHCHGGALFSDFGFRSNGLGEGNDTGRGGVTGRPADRGRFKTPSLRNVALTGPYMHDGRFRTLEEVVDHYDHGIRRDANLDPNLAKHPDAGLGLSAEDRRALVAFLRALTDVHAGNAFRNGADAYR